MEIINRVCDLLDTVEHFRINFHFEFTGLIQLDELRHLAWNLADEVQQEHSAQRSRFAQQNAVDAWLSDKLRLGKILADVADNHQPSAHREIFDAGVKHGAAD